MTKGQRSVVALAGRRIDSTDSADEHFPLSLVSEVEERIVVAFSSIRPNALVCSAACGADLIALGIARSQEIPFYIVLPFGRQKFKLTSVVDRPGNWANLYDGLIKEADAEGRLTELLDAGEGDSAYSRATAAIIATAKDVAKNSKVAAIAVTDKRARTSHDATAEFLDLAAEAGFDLHTVEIPIRR